jgi:tetratricopeptide (TPR) repeat protein
MGVAYFANNEFDNAILQLKKTFKINPFYFTDRVWYLTGLSYEKLGNKQTALKYYYKAFLINPSDEEIAGAFICQFNSKQEIKDFIIQHTAFIREDIIKVVEEHK